MAGKKLTRPPFRPLPPTQQEIKPLVQWLYLWKEQTGQSFKYLCETLELETSTIWRWTSGRRKPCQQALILDVARRIGVDPAQVKECKRKS